MIAVFTATVVANAANVIGVVSLKGTPPPEVPYTPLMNDPTCGPLHKETPTTHFYVVGKNAGLGDVIVFLKDADGKVITGKSTGATAPPSVLDQNGCLYTPQIMAIQTGQKLLIRNSDPCVHNVRCSSTAGNAPHNDAQLPGAPDLTYTFDKPEMFMRFQCDIHPWMFAWVSLFDNPYFCISDGDGNYSIKGVPPGKYTVVAEHRKLGEQTLTIEVSDKDVAANFTFEIK